MKEMLMKNLLIFTTVTGKNQLRGYVKVALGLFAILVVLVGVNTYNRNQMVSEIMATPRTLDADLIPAPTEQVEMHVPLDDECPSNPADWTLMENRSVPGSNLKELSPRCAYDQLDRTAAWLYSTSVLGYTRKDAADIFGFDSIPMEYQFESGGITVITDLKDEPQIVDLRFPSDNTGLKEWRIDANGNPAVEFTFSGCFRTSSLNGGEIVSWGNGYPVICQYSGDFTTRHYVSDVNGKTLTIGGSENLRRFMWFGYSGDGNWVFLGFAKNWEYDLSQIHNPGISTINQSQLTERYAVNFQPLPENWKTFTGQEFVDAFLEELDRSE